MIVIFMLLIAHLVDDPSSTEAATETATARYTSTILPLDDIVSIPPPSPGDLDCDDKKYTLIHLIITGAVMFLVGSIGMCVTCRSRRPDDESMIVQP
jgi:hypothetical protein